MCKPGLNVEVHSLKLGLTGVCFGHLNRVEILDNPFRNTNNGD